MLNNEVDLMENELFKTVRIGGYDKEEVLSFIKNKFIDLESTIEKNKEELKKNQELIDSLNSQIKEVEQKLASTLVENQRLVDVITHHESVLNQEYTQSQLTNALLSVKDVKDKIIKEAEIKSKTIIETAKSHAFQQITFKKGADETLASYENRYKRLMANLSSLTQISCSLTESIEKVTTELDNMKNSLPSDISEL